MGFKGRVIALTGNIACGKSTVARMLTELGVPVIDADQVSRDVTQPGSAPLHDIVATFGPQVLDDAGKLDRKSLRDLVFRNEAGRKKLESILHPAIRSRSADLIRAQFEAGHSVVVYEASLLIETGRHQDFDSVLLVTCDEKQQLARLRARDHGLTAELAGQMITAQMPQAEKQGFATWIIVNNGTVEDLRAKVHIWFDQNVGKKGPA